MPRAPLSEPLILRLWPLLVREWRHHPWRHAVALLAVALGVALSYSVQLINDSALAEFGAAVRSANGQPDLTLRGQRDGFDDNFFERLTADAGVEAASPVVEVDTYAATASGLRVALRVLGIDALRVASVAPELLPRPAAGEAPFVFLDPTAVFANPAARERLALVDGRPLSLQSGPAWKTLRLAGSVPAGGTPLVVMDIAGAQAEFGLVGRLTRIDLRLRPGTTPAQLLARTALPAGVSATTPGDDEQRVSQLSRAYRVNLTVLALVALFVGAFLVFSVISLSVAQRTPTFALLGVLGMTAAERRQFVLGECALLGLLGSLLGLLLGAGLAMAALRWLAGDLGGGYFPGIAPRIHVSPWATLGFAVLGTAAAVAGGWVPARQAERLSPALALKGLGDPGGDSPPASPGLVLLAAGVALAFAPPVAGLPLAAYLSVAALLFGGVSLVPAVVHALLAFVGSPRRALPLLALKRARFHRRTASAAVAGVVASLALSVALTVMVTSFRQRVATWLDDVLPADLYARAASHSAASDQAWLSADFVRAVAALPGVARLQASRSRPLRCSCLASRGDADGARARRARLAAADAGGTAAATARPGGHLRQRGDGLAVRRPRRQHAAPAPGQRRGRRCVVLGVWRDFARQFGAIAIDRATYRAADRRHALNDLALWLAPGADMAAVQKGLRALLPDPSMLEFVATTELRTVSLRIFDRSFAVTYYLQVVAIAIGLVGIAASLSAQVLARRKEFGLLAHLGLTRRQVIAVVAGEAAAWLAAGALIGLALGLAISVVLVHVVNPQSFHWTMALCCPGAGWRRCAPR
jgi:putative ABC transport system permease protein